MGIKIVPRHGKSLKDKLYIPAIFGGMKTTFTHFKENLIAWSGNDTRVSNVRGRGLMIAFDLPDSKTRDTLMTTIWQENVMILPCGQKSLRIRPHLDLTLDDANKAADVFQSSLKQI